MLRRFVATTILALALSVIADGVHAQTGTSESVTYFPGWTMVGGPPGTNFSSLAPLYAWNGVSYVNPASNVAMACQGYWALVSAQTTVTLANSSAGATQNCSLQTGWNLVGNPFAGPAVLPYGTAGYAINSASGAYMQVPAIAVGAAVWIYETVPTTIALQEAQTSRVPVTISISNVPSGPYSVHVGDSIQLFLPATPTYRATADASFLHFDAAGSVTTLTCIGEPACQFTTTRQYWSWHAVNPGTTFINIAPICPDGSQRCGVVTSIEIDIQP